jgi:predicted HicB family RNase H-like nuclease
MKNLMEHKGYLGSVNYNDEDKIFYGRVEYIRSLISSEVEKKKLREQLKQGAIERSPRDLNLAETWFNI